MIFGRFLVTVWHDVKFYLATLHYKFVTFSFALSGFQKRYWKSSELPFRH